jgi:glycosyltransferase involved in cell wall biosynthesis
VTVHDLGFRQLPWAHAPLARWYLDLSTQWAASRATRLIAVSEATALDLQRLYGVAPDRISVVHEGVGREFRPAIDQAALAAWRQSRGLGRRPYLLAVGTVQPRKNLRALLQAYRILLDADDHLAPLVVAGRAGRGEAALQSGIRQLGLSGRVHRLGFLPEAELPSLFAAALAYVQPSLYEGFGLTVPEALACGVPTIAANRSSLPELVGGAGLLVDPTRPAELAAAIRRLLDHPTLRMELAAAGPRRAAAFTWERCAEQTLAVLRAASRPVTDASEASLD